MADAKAAIAAIKGVQKIVEALAQALKGMAVACTKGVSEGGFLGGDVSGGLLKVSDDILERLKEERQAIANLKLDFEQLSILLQHTFSPQEEAPDFSSNERLSNLFKGLTADSAKIIKLFEVLKFSLIEKTDLFTNKEQGSLFSLVAPHTTSYFSWRTENASKALIRSAAPNVMGAYMSEASRNALFQHAAVSEVLDTLRTVVKEGVSKLSAADAHDISVDVGNESQDLSEQVQSLSLKLAQALAVAQERQARIEGLEKRVDSLTAAKAEAEARLTATATTREVVMQAAQQFGRRGPGSNAPSFDENAPIATRFVASVRGVMVSELFAEGLISPGRFDSLVLMRKFLTKLEPLNFLDAYGVSEWNEKYPDGNTTFPRISADQFADLKKGFLSQIWKWNSLLIKKEITPADLKMQVEGMLVEFFNGTPVSLPDAVREFYQSVQGLNCQDLDPVPTWDLLRQQKPIKNTAVLLKKYGAKGVDTLLLSQEDSQFLDGIIKQVEALKKSEGTPVKAQNTQLFRVESTNKGGALAAISTEMSK